MHELQYYLHIANVEASLCWLWNNRHVAFNIFPSDTKEILIKESIISLIIKPQSIISLILKSHNIANEK